MKAAPPSRSECLRRLGLDDTAQGPEIRRAYRRLALEYHPDRNGGSEESSRRFMRLAEAYRELMRQERERMKARNRPVTVSPAEIAKAQGWSTNPIQVSSGKPRRIRGWLMYLSRGVFVLGLAMVCIAGFTALCLEPNRTEFESSRDAESASVYYETSTGLLFDCMVVPGLWFCALACVLAFASWLSGRSTRHWARSVNWLQLTGIMLAVGMVAVLLGVPRLFSGQREVFLQSTPGKPENPTAVSSSSTTKPERTSSAQPRPSAVLRKKAEYPTAVSSSSTARPERTSSVRPSPSAAPWKRIEGGHYPPADSDGGRLDSILQPITPPSLRSLGLELDSRANDHSQR